MAVLIDNRNTLEMDSAFAQPMGRYRAVQSDIFYAGALLMFDTNDQRIKPAAASTTGIAIGRCEEYKSVDASEVYYPPCRSGVFRYDNSGSSDAIAQDDIGANCYMVDDQTVALTNGSAARSVAGKIVDVDASGVWVSVNPL